MLSAEDRARIKWSCRRGMLELDVIVMPFFDECFDELSEKEQQDFVALMKCDDPDLFSWMMGHTRSDNLAIAAMVDKVVAHNRSKLR
ncbi:succinate dehydrogenase assembly factor 2 [Thaumasiovibrio sp. DFM-14]|uniref:FAD assembly factor SdhE n=1 Tax=Thaumasiovibrio sp. DFM-14 TaxID=3384792 RepID=UPI0039A3B953